MVHLRPCKKIGPPFLHAAQIHEQFFFLPTEEPDKYFLMMVLAYSASGLLAILQQSLASKASFLALIWKMPRPPYSLGRVTTFQLTRCSFHFSWVDPQRKSLLSLSIAEQVLIGRAWHYI